MLIYDHFYAWISYSNACGQKPRSWAQCKRTYTDIGIIQACAWPITAQYAAGRCSINTAQGGALEWQEGVSGLSMDTQKAP